MEKKAKEDEREMEKVVLGDDLSLEILFRTSVRSLLQFKTLSKLCYSIVTSPNFLRLRNPNPDPPCGLFLRRSDAPGEYYFISLDVENPVRTPPFTTLDFAPRAASDPIEILQSCNGLLLCGTKSDMFYVYNPTINLFTTLPPPPLPLIDEDDEDDDDYDVNGEDNWWQYHRRLRTTNKVYVYGTTLAFDPSKSPHYKVICVKTARSPAHFFDDDHLVRISVYSSETGNWSVLGKPFGTDGFTHFTKGVCCNDAIHWPMMMPQVVEYFKFEEESHHYFEFETPTTIGGEHHSDFLAESHTGMLLVGIFYSYIGQFDVLEMKKDYSGWSFKYHVDFVEIFTPFAEMGSPNRCKFDMECFSGGKSEGDLFLILKIPGQLVQYNILPKTFRKLHDFVAGSLKIDGCFQFIPSLSGV